MRWVTLAGLLLAGCVGKAPHLAVVEERDEALERIELLKEQLADLRTQLSASTTKRTDLVEDMAGEFTKAKALNDALAKENAALRYKLGEPEAAFAKENPADGPLVASSVLRWSSQKKPTWPEDAIRLGLPAAHCRARVAIDEWGAVKKVVIGACPLVFHEPTRVLLHKWKAYPYRIDNARAKVQTVVDVIYTPPKPPEPKLPPGTPVIAP